jgi:hypothetical protein
VPTLSGLDPWIPTKPQGLIRLFVALGPSCQKFGVLVALVRRAMYLFFPARPMDVRIRFLYEFILPEWRAMVLFFKTVVSQC